VQYYFSGYNLQAVRQGPWKLAIKAQNETMGRDALPDANTSEPRLYNLDQEIGEKANVAAAHPEVIKELSALAEKMSAEIGGQNPTARRPAGIVKSPSLLYPAEPRRNAANAAKAAKTDQPKRKKNAK